MKIFNDLEKVKEIESTAIALGNFDGMHLGHAELVKNAVKKAKEENIKSAVFTFSNHPQNMISQSPKIKNILYPHEKSEIIAAMGVDYLFSIPFTEEIRDMEAEVFVDELLRKKFNGRHLFCGFNYHYGRRAGGRVEDLHRERGLVVHEMKPFKVNGTLVSSTLIRKLISEGRVDECNQYLGRNYSIGGEVLVGNKIGRTLGFPTSNIEIDNNMVQPSHGVYVTICDYNKHSYPAVTNVGIRPTIGDEKKTVETHIFNFDEELYNKHIRVEFLVKLRDEVKFDSLKELAAQVSKDKDAAAEYHKKRERNKSLR